MKCTFFGINGIGPDFFYTILYNIKYIAIIL